MLLTIPDWIVSLLYWCKYITTPHVIVAYAANHDLSVGFGLPAGQSLGVSARGRNEAMILEDVYSTIYHPQHLCQHLFHISFQASEG